MNSQTAQIYRRLVCGPALLCAIAVLAAALPGAGMAQTRPLAEQPVPVIRVSGEGKSALAPDMAVATFGVVQEADTARQALDANNEAMAAVIAAMKEAGVESRDLQTSGFSIQPRYIYPQPDREGRQKPPQIVGYTVTNQLAVRIRELDLVGAILDRAVTLGINSDGNISFVNDDPSAALKSARTDAMKDARERAETLAEAAGVELGALLEVSENHSQPRPVPIARSAKNIEFAADAVPVETGENSYTVTVQAVWQIEAK